MRSPSEAEVPYLTWTLMKVADRLCNGIEVVVKVLSLLLVGDNSYQCFIINVNLSYKKALSFSSFLELNHVLS